MTTTSSASLLKAAEIRDDRRLLLQIQGQDTIAIEIKYHKTCYAQYVRPGALAKLEDQNCEDEDVASETYNRAFGNIREYVNNTLLKEGKAVKMSELLEWYVRKLSQEGVNAPSYRSSKLKNRLIKSFGSSLSYHQTQETNEDEKYLHVYHTAKMIRSLVMEMKPVMALPPTEDDLDCSDTLVPDLLYNLFAWICSSDVEYVTLHGKTGKKVNAQAR